MIPTSRKKGFQKGPGQKSRKQFSSGLAKSGEGKKAQIMTRLTIISRSSTFDDQ